MRHVNRKTGKTLLMSLCIVLTMMLSTTLLMGAEARWIKVGSLHNFYQAHGCEPEEDFGDEQQFGMRWDAFYDHQDMQAAKGMWIAVADYDDPVANTTFRYKVAHNGPRPRPSIEVNEFMPVNFTMSGKFSAPTVIVDDELASDLDWDDIVDAGFDATAKADRTIHNSVHTSTGVSFDRTLYAYTDPYHDNFVIHEYVFYNTGVVSRDESVSHSATLDSVYFHWQFRWSVAGEGTVEGNVIDWRGRRGWATPQNCRWGMNTMNMVIGEDVNNPVTTSMFADEGGRMGVDEYDDDGEMMRAIYAWHGRHSDLSYDNIGSPNFQGWLADGMLGASQFIGAVVLHADESPSNRVDDLSQPTTTRKIESNDPETTNNDQFSAPRMERGYTSFVSPGHEELSQAEQVKSQGVYPNQFATAGGYSQTWSFGPYTMAPGDTVKIVWAEAAAGIDRRTNYVVGNTWFRSVALGENPTMVTADGSVTTDADEYKNSWVYSSRDSLMQTFRRARALYKNNLDLGTAVPPDPPQTFSVESQGTRIYLTWSDNAFTSHPNFEGYRLYRAKGQVDSTYHLLADLNMTDGTIAHEYSDMTAERGQLYFYYITAYDDGSTNIIAPGVGMESSAFYTRTNKGAQMKKPPAEGLDGITIVPNPYIISNNSLQYIGEKNSIKFWNLPNQCQINIFTERGDKIWTYDHLGSGVATWDLLTSSRQIIVSGLYIATFETPDGDKAIKKFVVVR